MCRGQQRRAGRVRHEQGRLWRRDRDCRPSPLVLWHFCLPISESSSISGRLTRLKIRGSALCRIIGSGLAGEGDTNPQRPAITFSGVYAGAGMARWLYIILRICARSSSLNVAGSTRRLLPVSIRSEERRVGEEWGSGGSEEAYR